MKKIIATILTAALVTMPTCSSALSGIDPRTSSSPFGVLTFLSWNHDWNNHAYSQEKLETAVRLMAESGVGIVRMDFLWDDIEPAPDRWDFAKYDHIVELLSKNNIKILGLLSYNAVWAAEYWNSAPNNFLFTKYARAVVDRYKDRVKYWEIWNEPDDATYWREQDGMKAYTKLLTSVYPAIKEADPTAVVLMGGVSKSIAPSLRSIYRYGGKDSFDAVNFHPFVNPKLPDAQNNFRGIHTGVLKTMEEFGDSKKPIWITEVGCPGLKQGEGQGWWMGKAPTEEEQAVWVKKVYNEALRLPNVEKVFWAFFQDTPNYFKNAVDYFGLIRVDFTKKPAFEIYRRMIQSARQSEG